jgi:ABC-type uncharacterized transport system permease subunit
MRIELKKRENMSALFSVLSPFIALGLTLIAGVILFVSLGKDPVSALYSFFIEPLTEVWSLHELAIKAAPLILIAVGLSVCYRSNNWNIGAEGQFIIGAMAGSVLPVVFHGWESPLMLPLMLVCGMIGGAAYAAIPAFLKARLNTNEILTSLMLVYVAQLLLDWTVRGPWRNPEGFNFPETRNFAENAILPRIIETGKTHYGFGFALIAALVLWFAERTLKGFEITRARPEPAGRAVRRFSYTGTVITTFPDLPAAWPAWPASEVSGAIGQLRPVDFARLRLHGHHRRLPGPAQSARHRRRRPCSGTVLSRRRGGTDLERHHPNKVASMFQGFLLFFVLACDTLIHYRIRMVRRRRGRDREYRMMDMTEAILLTIMPPRRRRC